MQMSLQGLSVSMLTSTQVPNGLLSFTFVFPGQWSPPYCLRVWYNSTTPCLLARRSTICSVLKVTPSEWDGNNEVDENLTGFISLHNISFTCRKLTRESQIVVMYSGLTVCHMGWVGVISLEFLNSVVPISKLQTYFVHFQTHLNSVGPCNSHEH